MLVAVEPVDHLPGLGVAEDYLAGVARLPRVVVIRVAPAAEARMVPSRMKAMLVTTDGEWPVNRRRSAWNQWAR